jgi:hypothetical protein
MELHAAGAMRQARFDDVRSPREMQGGEVSLHFPYIDSGDVVEVELSY